MTTLREMRERLGLRTVDVASALGIADSTVRNWDRGRTVPKLRADQFIRLLRLYQITPDQLWDALPPIEQSLKQANADPRSDLP
jgi:putative transcriptional regulator